MRKFKLGDFVAHVPTSFDNKPGFTLLEIVGYDEKRKKYICLCYDLYEFSPCCIFLCKEEDLEILKQGLVPPGDIEIRRSIPLESIDFYSYAVLDVDGTKQVKIRNAIHHSPGQFD